MTSKLPWATVTIIIVVVAAIGAWKIFANPTTSVTPTTGYATVAVGSTNVVFTGTIPTVSGIENIYIMDTGTYTKTNNLGTITTGRMGVIESSGTSCNIPYENSFDIVVAFRLQAPENAAYACKENARLELAASGSFTITLENAGFDNMRVFENSNYYQHSGWIRVNAVWDNGGSGYILPAGGTISLNPINLYGWFF